MNKVLPLLLSAGLSLPLQSLAAEEFEDAVPVDLVEIFLGLNAGSGGVYRDLPEEFPIAAPEGFEVLGTVDRTFSRSVYLSTNLNTEQALAAITRVLEEADWHRLSSPYDEAARAQGFVDVRGFLPPVAMCHEQAGNMQISVAPEREPVVVTLQFSPQALQPQVPGCLERIEQFQRVTAMRRVPGGELGQYVPRLELPSDGDYYGRRPGPTGSFSTSGRNEVQASTEIRIGWEAPQLYAHFAGQLEQQGWTQGAEWSAPGMAGGSWSREVDDLTLRGLVTILRLGPGTEEVPDRYDLQFRLVSVEDERVSVTR